MFLKYGTYTHAADECSLVVTRTPRFNEGGQVVSVIEQWQISGFIQAATQAALTTALAALKTAYATNGLDLTLFLNDGVTPTHHAIANADTLGGVRVVSAPSFPMGRGAEYGGFRSYTVALEAEIPVSGYAALLVFFEETLSFSGGGSRFVHLQTLTGNAQKQTVAAATPYRATQEGISVGYAASPSIPGPLWVADEMRDQRRINYRSPKRRGPVGAPAYTEYESTWSYQFESVNALSGSPSLWS
jgi:hypothetical protein